MPINVSAYWKFAMIGVAYALIGAIVGAEVSAEEPLHITSPPGYPFTAKERSEIASRILSAPSIASAMNEEKTIVLSVSSSFDDAKQKGARLAQIILLNSDSGVASRVVLNTQLSSNSTW